MGDVDAPTEFHGSVRGKLHRRHRRRLSRWQEADRRGAKALTLRAAALIEAEGIDQAREAFNQDGAFKY